MDPKIAPDRRIFVQFSIHFVSLLSRKTRLNNLLFCTVRLCGARVWSGRRRVCVIVNLVQYELGRIKIK